MALAARTNAASVSSARSSKAFAAPRVSSRRVALRVRAGEAAPAEGKGLEKSVPALKAVLDIEAIKGILPHRCVRRGGIRSAFRALLPPRSRCMRRRCVHPRRSFGPRRALHKRPAAKRCARWQAAAAARRLVGCRRNRRARARSAAKHSLSVSAAHPSQPPPRAPPPATPSCWLTAWWRLCPSSTRSATRTSRSTTSSSTATSPSARSCPVRWAGWAFCVYVCRGSSRLQAQQEIRDLHMKTAMP